MSRPPFNVEMVEAATQLGLARTHIRIFQPHRYGKDDADQMKVIARMMLPFPGKVVVDVGCGVGEVSRRLAEMNPELQFVLINVSPYQLSLCPSGDRFHPVLGDWHDLELPPESADLVMFHAALCQMDIERALTQAFRVLRTGGCLFVNDMFRVMGDGRQWEELLAARVMPLPDLTCAIRASGFSLERVETPVAYDDTFLQELLEENDLRHLASEVRPVLIRAVKEVTHHQAGASGPQGEDSR